MTAKKSKIPYFFFVFFAVVFAVDAYYVYISKKTWRGVVTEDAYRTGLHYNDVIADGKKQEDLGWKSKISYKNSGDKTGDLEVVLTDKNGAEISDAIVEVYFKRPTQDGQDFSQNLKFLNGAYRTKVEFPLKGQWEFLVNASRLSDNFKESKRYVVQ